MREVPLYVLEVWRAPQNFHQPFPRVGALCFVSSIEPSGAVFERRTFRRKGIDVDGNSPCCIFVY